MQRIVVLALISCVGMTTAALCGQEKDRNRPVPLEPDVGRRCLEVLRKALNGDDFWPAMHAAEGLTLAGQTAEVNAALKARLAGDEDYLHRCGLAREIVRAGNREPLTILWNTLADLQSKGRVHAAESLYKIAEAGDGRVLGAAWRQREDPVLGIMAGAALARAGHQAALRRLRENLTLDNRDVRRLSAWVLGLLGTAEDISPIKKLLAAESDAEAKAFYVNALACLGDPEARAELGRNLSSDDPPTRAYAAEFAGYSRAVELRPRLVQMLDDPNVDVRVRASQSLIVLSQPAYVLGLPGTVAADDIRVDVYEATREKPRYSEGSIVALRDGSLLFATTEFVGGGADHATATIVVRASTDGGRTWGPQRTLQENIGRQNVMSVTLRRLPPGDDLAPLGMFFLVKNSSSDLKIHLRISKDEGRSFDKSIVVTTGPGYHVMNNDRVTLLAGGRLICPVAWTNDVSQGGHFICTSFLSDDGGLTWRQGTDRVDQPKRGAMEPEVVELAGGRLMMIVRTQLGCIATSFSEDRGDHWSAPAKLPLDAPESPATIRVIPATGDLLLVWNQTYDSSSGHGGLRTPLTAAVSSDGGRSWEHVHQLETDGKQQYAYTSLLFHKDRVLLSYYVADRSGRISSRFRSLPVNWFYETR